MARIAESQARRVQVGIRVNPDVTTDTHPYISTGKSGIKFGLPTDQVLPAAQFIAAHPQLELTTLAMHLGSQLVDLDPFLQGIGRLLDLVERVRQNGVTTLRVLDIGGGLGIRYAEERAIGTGGFAAAVVPRLAPTGLTVYLEPGRFLVGSAGVLLTRVLYRKHSGGKEFVVVDAGMNDLVRPSHYQAYHEIVELEERDRSSVRADVVGTGLRDRRLPGAGPDAARPSRGRGPGGARRRRIRIRHGLELQQPAHGPRRSWWTGQVVGGAAQGDGRGPVRRTRLPR